MAITAHGLGPLKSGSSGASPRRRLGTLRSSDVGTMTALDTAGRFGSQLLALVGALGGTMTAEAMARETANADPTEFALAVDRLCAARLLERDPGNESTLLLGGKPAESWHTAPASMADQHAMTSDALALICRRLGLKAPNRTGTHRRHRCTVRRPGPSTGRPTGFLQRGPRAAGLDRRPGRPSHHRGRDVRVRPLLTPFS